MTLSSPFLRSTGLAAVSSLLLTSIVPAFSYDNSADDNLVLYWGQNSYGATHSDTANFQKNLTFYCGSDSVTDAFPIAFLTAVDAEDGLPSIDLSNICNIIDDPSFPGTELPICQFMADDIKTCQAAGKIVTLSIGGATGGVGLSTDAAAVAFADVIWNTFLGGSSATRPFGDAVLDGVDLDIEGGGSGSYPAFVTRIRSYAASANKPYYITAAPQCPFPDANLNAVLDAVGFDAVYVQFCEFHNLPASSNWDLMSNQDNNFCGLQNFDDVNAWNFDQWDDWAKNTSPNPDVKIYIGAPASSTAAGSGYVDASTLASIIQITQSQYSSFGGVMMWDASQAYANDRYDISVKNALTGGDVPVPTTSIPSTTSPTTTTPPVSSPTSGSCAGVAAWTSGVAYVGGSQVTYNGHLWTAMWWTESDTPGGSAGVWTDDGACSTLPDAATAFVDASPSSVAQKPFATDVPFSSIDGDTSSAVGSSSIVKGSEMASASEPLASTSTAARRAMRFDRNL